MLTGNKLMLAVLAGAALFAFTAQVQAQVPDTIPVQGVLTDDDGVPLEGSHDVTFSIYDAESGGTLLWSEVQTVMVDRGSFTAYLGKVATMDLSIFSGQTVYLGIKVGSDDEMTPRLQFGTVPYAARAAECDSVPTGSVMFFDLPACPAGWSEMVALRGRVPVGIPASGTPGAMVGAALANRGRRTISQVPRHGHAVNPPNTATTPSGVHSHGIPTRDILTDFAGTHNHGGRTGSEITTIDMGHGNFSTNAVQGADTAGEFEIDQEEPTDPAHRHTIPSDGQHRHSITIPSRTTNSVDNHVHNVDIGAFNSDLTGAASVDVTMPYVQLVACRKN